MTIPADERFSRFYHLCEIDGVDWWIEGLSPMNFSGSVEVQIMTLDPLGPTDWHTVYRRDGFTTRAQVIYHYNEIAARLGDYDGLIEDLRVDQMEDAL